MKPGLPIATGKGNPGFLLLWSSPRPPPYLLLPVTMGNPAPQAGLN